MFVVEKKDLVRRFKRNPIITPRDVKPSTDDFEVVGAFNAASFEYNGRIGLLLRVAERPVQKPDKIRIPYIDEQTRVLSFRQYDRTSPHINVSDPRAVLYKGRLYLTSVSHLRLAWSDDGLNFTVDPKPTIWPMGEYETFGIEDPRVTKIGRKYYITYSAVSDHEVAVGMITTKDWQTFKREGLILHPFNKDVCLLPSDTTRKYWLIHRPSGVMWARNWMWISESRDLSHWGHSRCLARTRAGKFDGGRLGAGAPPVLTDKGYLEIYHGASASYRYCLGAMLLDRRDPGKIVARSDKPLMEPLAQYERKGFFGNVVFTDGVLVRGDEMWIYYGASDSVTCVAKVELGTIWDHLGV